MELHLHAVAAVHGWCNESVRLSLCKWYSGICVINTEKRTLVCHQIQYVVYENVQTLQASSARYI